MDAMFDKDISKALEAWLITGSVVVIASGLALLGHAIIFAILGRVSRRTSSSIDNAFIRYARAPTRILLVVLVLFLILPSLDLADSFRASLQRILSITLTATLGWLAFNLSKTIQDMVAARHDLSVADNLEAREVQTRIRLLQRILGAVIIVVTGCLILISIPGIRQIGITLFASAGIAGLIGGLAARPMLSNLIAGIQLALTQPIRIDDVVIVEGEWGWIEEIRMTYIVIRVWDLRRLIVPLNYFIETPFQNWTRKTADLLGTVFLYTDYTVPIQDVREELHRILESSDLWDGEVWGLQVTNTTDKTVELRALMGAHNSGDAWTLRCYVREKLIEFLQRSYPDALPRVRAEVVDRMPDLPSDEGPAPETEKG